MWQEENKNAFSHDTHRSMSKADLWTEIQSLALMSICKADAHEPSNILYIPHVASLTSSPMPFLTMPVLIAATQPCRTKARYTDAGVSSRSMRVTTLLPAQQPQSRPQQQQATHQTWGRAACKLFCLTSACNLAAVLPPRLCFNRTAQLTTVRPMQHYAARPTGGVQDRMLSIPSQGSRG